MTSQQRACSLRSRAFSLRRVRLHCTQHATLYQRVETTGTARTRCRCGRARVHRSALRHLELHAFAVRDLVREMEVELVWVDTESNPSDLLTKAITSKAKFDRFAKLILGAVDGTYATFLASAHRAVLRSG